MGGHPIVTTLRAVCAATLGVLLLPLSAVAQDVTFTKDIAPLFQEKCQTCHRPGTVAPMSLVTYQDARPWATAIKNRVSTRAMPPWPMDKTVGVQRFKNDISLSEEQIATIVRWVDGGAPMGNLADMPAPREWPDPDAWNYEARFGRPPDLVISSPSYHVKAGGIDEWPTPEVRIPLTDLSEERWISAIELRPGNTDSRYAFHHANPSLIPPTAADDPDRLERYQLTDSAVGTEGFIFPDDSGKRIVPGSSVSFGMHLWPLNDRDVDVVLQIGLWFYPQGDRPKHETEGEVLFQVSQGTRLGEVARTDRGPTAADKVNPQLVTHSDLLIPPNSVSIIRGVHVLPRNARVHSLRGHMHFRGKHQVVEVIYPDGRWETLNKLNWDHAWHTAFLYEDDAMPLLPKGTTLILTSEFDNTRANRYNPDPDQWVAGGRRSADEMSHLRLGITWFSDEEFAALVAERKALEARQSQQQD
ncbi:MAG: cytochrome c [Vicinamibacterales bacterium]